MVTYSGGPMRVQHACPHHRQRIICAPIVFITVEMLIQCIQTRAVNNTVVFLLRFIGYSVLIQCGKISMIKGKKGELRLFVPLAFCMSIYVYTGMIQKNMYIFITHSLT